MRHMIPVGGGHSGHHGKHCFLAPLLHRQADQGHTLDRNPRHHAAFGIGAAAQFGDHPASPDRAVAFPGDIDGAHPALAAAQPFDDQKRHAPGVPVHGIVFCRLVLIQQPGQAHPRRIHEYQVALAEQAVRVFDKAVHGLSFIVPLDQPGAEALQMQRGGGRSRPAVPQEHDGAVLFFAFRQVGNGEKGGFGPAVRGVEHEVLRNAPEGNGLSSRLDFALGRKAAGGKHLRAEGFGKRCAHAFPPFEPAIRSAACALPQRTPETVTVISPSGGSFTGKRTSFLE